jgi:hypothetical protein
MKPAAQGEGDKEPFFDPTQNVLNLVAAETKRQDDLRAAEGRRLDELRAQAERYQNDLRDQVEKYQGKLDRAEANRIDALLAANTNSVALALARQELQTQAQDKRVAALEIARGEQMGKAAAYASIAAFLGVVAAIIGHYWK